jgi:hypothetical protein
MLCSAQPLHLVGRGAEHRSDFLNIRQKYVSSTHFSIQRSLMDHQTEGECEENFCLKDLSTNGTYINGKTLGKNNSVMLLDGDEIGLKFKDELKVAYIFNKVKGMDEVPEIVQPSAPVSRAYDNTKPHPFRESEFEALNKQIALLQSELEDQESRFSSVVAKKESVTRALAASTLSLEAAREGSAAQDEEIKRLSERAMDLEAHTASVQARCRIQEEQIVAVKSQLEAQRSKSTVSVETELMVEDLKAKVAALKEELGRKAVQAEARQRLVDETGAALAREAAGREGAEADMHRLRSALMSAHSDLHSSEVARSTASMGLADAAHRLASALSAEKQLMALLHRSQRVILAQRGAMATSLRSMAGVYRHLGQALSAHLSHTPLDLDLARGAGAGGGEKLHIPGEVERADVDSQIEDLRRGASGGAMDVCAYHSLLMVVESEVLPADTDKDGDRGKDGDRDRDGEDNQMTCVDSLLASSRLPSLPSVRSNAADDGEFTSQLSRQFSRPLEGETQAQFEERGATPVHFATQQAEDGAEDAAGDVDNNATGRPMLTVLGRLINMISIVLVLS